MVQAVIAQKCSKVDTDYHKISMSILTMFRVAKKEEKETDKWLNQDFSQDDNNVEKKKAGARALARKRYSTTEIKARNLLTNIADKRYIKSDFNNSNFVIYVYSFLLQNLIL